VIVPLLYNPLAWPADAAALHARPTIEG
jgi:hypothetical protein